MKSGGTPVAGVPWSSKKMTAAEVKAFLAQQAASPVAPKAPPTTAKAPTQPKKTPVTPTPVATKPAPKVIASGGTPVEGFPWSTGSLATAPVSTKVKDPLSVAPATPAPLPSLDQQKKSIELPWVAKPAVDQKPPVADFPWSTGPTSGGTPVPGFPWSSTKTATPKATTPVAEPAPVKKETPVATAKPYGTGTIYGGGPPVPGFPWSKR